MPAFRPRMWPTIFTSGVVLLCLCLAVWQLERLAWKNALIAERTATLSQAPVAPPRSLDEARGMAFRPVRAEGTYLHDKELDLAATSEGGVQGYQILTPLRLDDGRTLLVDRGFVPSALREAGKRMAGQVTGRVTVLGLLRLAPAEKPGWFLPANRPDLNFWFWVDLPAMATADSLSDVAPFYLDADKSPNPGGWPRGGVTRLELPNDHLQYALTWFALALAAAGVFIAYTLQDSRPAASTAAS